MFEYELGLQPVLDLSIAEKSKVDYWVISPKEQEINEHIENLRKRYGQVTHPDTIKKEDMLSVSFQELIDDSPKEDGISNTSSLLSNNIEMTSKLSNANVFAILIAAAVHDVGHPARNNQFLITTQHRLATVYHDQSVLENYHIARSMELMETEKWSLLSGFSKDETSDIRALMIKSILHTDMAKHGDLVRNLTLDLDHCRNYFHLTFLLILLFDSFY